MMKLLQSLLVSLIVASCGPLFDKDKPDPAPNNRITETQKQALYDLRADIATWARECSGGIACGTNSNGSANDGDSMLWAGLLCLSGEQQQCTAVRLSVGSEGSLHRNPDQDRTKNSFSRDMMMGFLAYLAKTKDHSLGMLAHSFIKANDDKLCTDTADNRCNFTQPQYNAGWNLWYEIWKYHGYTPTDSMKHARIYGGELLVNLQSIFATEGYPRHLVGVELLIHQYVDDWTIWMQNSADQLVAFQPDNPFFEYVANGPTKRAAQLVLDKCPSEQPQPKSDDWAWQRDESEQAWLKAKGWDCIFMVNMLLGDRQ